MKGSGGWYPTLGELWAGWLRIRTMEKDTAHCASVHHELFLAVVILQKNHAAAESVQFPAADPFPA
jgi:hypothetical protein